VKTRSSGAHSAGGGKPNGLIHAQGGSAFFREWFFNGIRHQRSFRRHLNMKGAPPIAGIIVCAQEEAGVRPRILGWHVAVRLIDPVHGALVHEKASRVNAPLAR
jgi:hypothetical protein